MKFLRHISLLIAFFSMTGSLLAQPRVPERPSPPKLVNNLSKEFPDFFTQAQESMLEYKLVNFESETSNQIVVIIVDSLDGYDANAFATEVGHKWGVGQGKFDNGVVVLIKPTGGDGERDAYIAVGYGLEGVITDITATQIVENEMVSNFKIGKLYDGVDAAITKVMALAKGEITAPEYAQSVEKDYNAAGFMVWLFPLLLLTFIGFMAYKMRNSKGYSISRVSSGSSYSSYSSGSSYSSSSSRGSSSSGSSRSFGGFGGGGFGGGGGGGKW